MAHRQEENLVPDSSLPPLKRRRFREAETLILSTNTNDYEQTSTRQNEHTLISEQHSPLNFANHKSAFMKPEQTPILCPIPVRFDSAYTFHTSFEAIKQPSNKTKRKEKAKDRFTLITSFDWNIDPVIHACPYGCSREFDSLNGLEAHVKQAHEQVHKTNPKQMPTFTFSCRFCTYVCQYKQRLITHLNKGKIEIIS
jgi:hypothetical protein